jgi:anti-sigma B factor antagonist
VYTPAPRPKRPDIYSAKEATDVALKIANREVDGVNVLALDGRIVFGEETSSVRDEVKKLLAAGKRKLVLNMEKVSFVDSTGLGMLVSLRQSAKSANAQLRLSNVEARYSELLKMTQLWPLFDVSATEAEAVHALNK